MLCIGQQNNFLNKIYLDGNRTRSALIDIYIYIDFTIQMNYSAPKTQFLYSLDFHHSGYPHPNIDSSYATKINSWQSTHESLTEKYSGSTFPKRLRLRQPRGSLDKHETAPQTPCSEPKDRFQSIMDLALQQNQNLKKQNSFLLGKLRRMQRKSIKNERSASQAQKYKNLYQQSIEELAIIKQECQAYKDKARDMKNLALKNIMSLQKKIKMSTNEDSDSCQSFSIYSFFDKEGEDSQKCQLRKSTEVSQNSEAY